MTGRSQGTELDIRWRRWNSREGVKGQGRDKSLHQKPPRGIPGNGALGIRPSGGEAAARGPGRPSGRGAGAGVRPVLTEWATPHRNTPTSGSAARNTFTFCCTKCFFLVLEAKPNPGPGPPAAAGAVAGGTEEDAIVSRAPERIEAGAGRNSEARPGSGAHLRSRHVTGGPPSGVLAGRGGAGRGRRGWLHPLGRAAVTWRGLRSLVYRVGAVQGGAPAASGSVQFLVDELCPETNALFENGLLA